MTLTKCKFTRFKYKLIAPIPIYNKTITTREGFYITLLKNNFPIGYGEICPLPGLSKETITDVAKAIKSLSNITFNTEEPIFTQLKKFSVFSTLPSVQFGIESACLMALDTLHQRTIPSHYFIQDLKTTETLWKNNAYVKCKLGKNPLKIELTNILNLIKQVPTIKFRFDANQRLTMRDAINFFKQIPLNNIDYIEDPCNLNDIELFQKETNLPIAIDTPPLTQTIKCPIKALVIKPTLCGGVSNIQELKARFSPQKTIFSSCYESPIGIASLVRLASLLNPSYVHGLNTLPVFDISPRFTQKQHFSSFQPSQCEPWLQ